MTSDSQNVAIYECLCFDDAWESILRGWFAKQLESPLLKLPRVVIVPNTSAILFVKEQLLRHDIPLLGIRFHTPGTLRHYLLEVYKHSEPLELRENLHLLMKVVANELDANPVARAAAVEPEQFVRLADLLETAGWEPDVLKSAYTKVLIKKYQKEQERCGLVTTQKITHILSELSENPLQAFSSLLIFGFCSRDWLNYRILLTAVKSSNESIVCFLTKDNTRLVDQAWVGSWEQEFGPINRLFSTLGEKPFSYLSYYFDDIGEQRGVRQGDQLPEIYIAEDILREAEVIVARIVQALVQENVVRLGVVFPNQTSLLAREVARLLEAEQISHYNHLGYVGGRSSQQKLFESWMIWQRSPRFGAFLAFLDLLTYEGLLSFEEFRSFNSCGSKALQDLLTDDLRIIWSYLRLIKSDNGVLALIKQWALIPEEATFDIYISFVQPVLEVIGWTENFELVKKRAGILGERLEKNIKKADFLSWLASVTKPMGRVCNYWGENEYSCIFLITEDEALTQSWSHLILAGLNRAEWPSEKPEVIFLEDREIAELNNESLMQGNQGEGHLCVRDGFSLLLSSIDQYEISKSNFSTLLGAPTKRLILTAHVKDPQNFKDALMSEFLEKVYWISEGTLLSEDSVGNIIDRTKSWTSKYRAKNSINNSQIENIKNAYIKRRTADEPFDEYSFCFKSSNKSAFNLPCKAWEDIIATPERAWFRHILGAEKNEVLLGKSLYALAKGAWVHSWISLNDDECAVRMNDSEWSASIDNKASKVYELVEKAFNLLGRPVPDIWKANWYESRRTALSLIDSLAGALDGQYLFSEYKISKNELIKDTKTKIVEVPLRGRVDLLVYPVSNLECKNYPLWIIDFKTGASGPLTESKIKKGLGLQLALYALAFYFEGFENIEVSIAQPGVPINRQVDVSCILESRSVLEGINYIYASGKLGLRGSMKGNYGSTSMFPLATINVADDIIDRKWELTHTCFDV